MSNVHANNSSVWKIRKSAEPMPLGKRDPFRAARGIIWWFSASLLFWGVIAVLVLSG